VSELSSEESHVIEEEIVGRYPQNSDYILSEINTPSLVPVIKKKKVRGIKTTMRVVD
jgi:hypothetical protein